MATNTLCWTDIPVHDLERAVKFYSAVLGQAVEVQKFEKWQFALLPHATESVSGCLAPADADNSPSEKGPLIYLSVDGRLDEAVGEVSKNGGRILRTKHPIGPHGFRAIVVDSEGNRLALHSPKS
jgi:predicted enzyme related to lactoylglutathione lyase